MQAEGELDHIGDAVGHALAQLVFERVGRAARFQKARLEMFLADDSELPGLTGFECRFIAASSLATPALFTRSTPKKRASD